ncbi:two-partner secretion domain-containing protein [Candidatus Marithrix sp. Canyon 246]|uniref:two-partner secretion domain-containing protein n=1 Tax=Candidatus Marithrix sp. Canyon 246 TaxID=1827136 RepID=UPI00084A0FF9|nr:filamentous hemagglutinin N-terminal domain-containing protein [Candidatus Marithrix sp. Canyon 246]
MQYHILFIICIKFIYSRVAFAEIVLNGSALDGPNFVIEANMGQQYGGNLFHSFDQFNIKLNERATFSGPNSVTNIISRVTGGKTSTIDGVLESTIPDADFYLINPAGIVFGEKAELNVQGSFYASTADYLRLGINGKFNATHPEDSVLTVAPPSDFGFLGSNRAPITFENTTLSVADTFGITAGDIKLTNSRLSAPNIVIRGEKFWAKNSLIQANTKISIATTDSIHLATDAVINIDSFGNIFLDTVDFLIEANGLIVGNSYQDGAAAAINIKAHNIVIKDQASINADSYGSGKAGNVRIETNQFDMIGDTQITAANNVGNITIIADEITMADDATINTMSYFNQFNAGNIKIDANKLSMTDRAWIISSSFNHGKSGSINIQTNDLNLNYKSAISSMSFGKGNAGDITIRVHDAITITEAAVVASGTTGSGNVGNLFLILPHDQINAAEKVSSITQAKNVVTDEIADILNLAQKGGKAGNVFIISDELLAIKNGAIALNEELLLTSCTLSNGKSAFIVEKRNGLADAFKD